MKLSDFVGEHELSGVDTGITKAVDRWDEDSNHVIFIIDNKTYKAVENPGDGYRSYLEDLITTDEKVSNTFNPVKVFGRMIDDEEYENNDILELMDVITKKLVLKIGTGNVDDYYPYCVMEYTPENMAVNQ